MWDSIAVHLSHNLSTPLDDVLAWPLSKAKRWLDAVNAYHTPKDS